MDEDDSARRSCLQLLVSSVLWVAITSDNSSYLTSFLLPPIASQLHSVIRVGLVRQVVEDAANARIGSFR